MVNFLIFWSRNTSTYKWAPAVSLDATWQIYARVMPRPPWSSGLQQMQVQSDSILLKSLANEAWRRLRVPVEVMALPKRWSRFGLASEEMSTRVDLTHSSSRWPNAVEHVCSQRNRNHQVFGISDAHHIAWFVLRQPVGAGIDPVRPYQYRRIHWRFCSVSLTLHSTTPYPRLQKDRQWLRPAYSLRPSPRSILSSSPNPNLLE